MTALRLLALAPFVPRLDATHGGSRAVAELLARLGERHRVALLALRAEGEPPVDPLLRNRCEMVREVHRPGEADGGHAATLRVALGLAAGTPMWASRWSVTAFRSMAADLVRSWNPDIVQAEYHVMAQYFERLPGHAPRVLRQLEPGAASAGERSAQRRGPSRLLGPLDHRAWKCYESRAMAGADTVVALTDRDRESLLPLAGDTPVVVIPLGVPIPGRAADPAGRDPSMVLFVGNFIHPPNRDAAERLVTGILPLLRARYPRAVVRIVGPHPPPALVTGAAPGVTVTGEVADVRPHLDDAAVVVAPIRLGGGMRVKVAEALAAGKAVVATPLAAEGLSAKDGEHLLIAETDDAIAEAIAVLLRDPSRRTALAARAREFATTALGWDGPVAAFEQLYARLLAVPRPHG
ncbi:MAG TPA: glycosyltransferase family 4 protein [Gemmatimonadales bacterium]|nr:glycosyltransferase family 4 protein [Gemmatimonadales bacterium]